MCFFQFLTQLVASILTIWFSDAKTFVLQWHFSLRIVYIKLFNWYSQTKSTCVYDFFHLKRLNCIYFKKTLTYVVLRWTQHAQYLFFVVSAIYFVSSYLFWITYNNNKHFNIYLKVIYDLNITGIEEKLLYSTQHYVKEIDLNSGVVKVLIGTGSLAYSLTYDYDEKYLYIPRTQGDIIRYFFFKLWNLQLYSLNIGQIISEVKYVICIVSLI